MYLLDANACIGILSGRSPGVRDRDKSVPYNGIMMCSPVKAELMAGARKSQRVARSLAVVEALFKPHRCLSFDEAAADHYSIIRADLARSGDLTLVTHNTREFGRVVGLRIADWES